MGHAHKGDQLWVALLPLPRLRAFTDQLSGRRPYLPSACRMILLACILTRIADWSPALRSLQAGEMRAPDL